MRHFGVQWHAGFLEPLDTLWTRAGWAGVDLFFVLSGFLVGGLLLQEYKKRGGQIDVRRFIVRRAFKIWPLYYVYLAFVVARVVLRDPATGGLLAAVAGIWPNLLHIQNYRPVAATPAGIDLVFLGAPLLHTWTLAVEEHFYLVLPLLLGGAARRGDAYFHRAFRVAAALVLTLPLLLRTLQWAQGNYASINATHLRIDSLFWGVALAYVYHLHPEAWARLTGRPGLLAAVGFALLLPIFVWPIEHPFIWTVGFSVVAVAFGCLLAALLSERSRLAPALRIRRVVWGLPLRAVAFIGVYSYPVYLWHMTFGQTLAKWFLRHDWLTGSGALRWLVTIGLYILGSTIVGVVFGKVVEYPALALRERLFPSRAAALEARAPAEAPYIPCR